MGIYWLIVGTRLFAVFPRLFMNSVEEELVARTLGFWVAGMSVGFVLTSVLPATYLLLRSDAIARRLLRDDAAVELQINAVELYGVGCALIAIAVGLNGLYTAGIGLVMGIYLLADPAEFDLWQGQVAGGISGLGQIGLAWLLWAHAKRRLSNTGVHLVESPEGHGG